MTNSGHNYTFGMSLISKSRWDRAFGITVSVEDAIKGFLENAEVSIRKPYETKPIKLTRFCSLLPMTDEQIIDMEVGIKKHNRHEWIIDDVGFEHAKPINKYILTTYYIKEEK